MADKLSDDTVEVRLRLRSAAERPVYCVSLLEASRPQELELSSKTFQKIMSGGIKPSLICLSSVITLAQSGQQNGMHKTCGVNLANRQA